MARFSPWPVDEPLDPTERAQALIEQVLRPNLHRAFPLPAPGHGEDQHFRFLLDTLAYVTNSRPKDRSLRPGP